MRNKGAVIILTLVITALCVYYLSFTFVSRNIQQDAISYATEQNDVINLSKKQAYLDSIWNMPVYNLFGAEFTYKEVKDNELSLGLDLQGGMHVTLEVSPVDIIKGLSGNNTDPQFIESIRLARERQKDSQERFSALFRTAYEETSDDGRLAPLFVTAANRERFSVDMSNDQVMEVIDREIEDAIDRSFIILRTRIDQFGTSQPNIQRLQGTGRIQIEIPGAENPERIRKLLQGVAKLEFWEVANPDEYLSSLISINEMLVEEMKNEKTLGGDLESNLTQVQDDNSQADLSDLLSADDGDSLSASASDSLATDGLDSLTNTEVSPLFSLLRSQNELIYEVKDTAVIGEILRKDEVKSMLPRNVKPLWEVKPNIDEETGTEYLTLYFVRVGRGGKAQLTGEVITDARQDIDERGRAVVSMQMNAVGTKGWRNMTEKAAAKATATSLSDRIAIVLDNNVYSAPYVEEPIPNGSSRISGNFTVEEAKDLSNILKAGSLPAPTRIVEEAIVGPTLGKIAQRQGIISIISGLGIVVLFMIAYYSKGGFVANIALVFNIFFILGILAQFNAALTLPGIAGIVLTIGMSIDANVLIFERIREELRHGVRLREAITMGYQKAFSSIVDANLTTLLTAAILYILGQGPIKGFAITLMIGIFCSFFSAVYITRVIIEWMTRKGDESHVSFNTPFSKNLFSELDFDFMSKRKKAYVFSAIIIVIGIGLATFQGLNLGVDFKGGRSYVVNFSDPVVATDLKLALGESFEGSGTEVKNYGGNNIVKVTTSYKVDDESDAADDEVKNALVSGIESYTGLEYVADAATIDDQHFTISGSAKVGATIADDIVTASWEAGIVSIIVIFLYILIRFRKWQFSTGAIVALLHDTAFVFAAFAIAGLFGIKFEIDQVFVAALLTVIGYSINDTVIVFDRIREFLGLGTSTDNVKIFNAAINSTLNRTLITSFTTMIVVLILFIFGGEVLRGFSFALLVGILVGTYSSVFIASPVVIDLQKDHKGKKA